MRRALPLVLAAAACAPAEGRQLALLVRADDAVVPFLAAFEVVTLDGDRHVDAVRFDVTPDRPTCAPFSLGILPSRAEATEVTIEITARLFERPPAIKRLRARFLEGLRRVDVAFEPACVGASGCDAELELLAPSPTTAAEVEAESRECVPSPRTLDCVNRGGCFGAGRFCKLSCDERPPTIARPLPPAPTATVTPVRLEPCPAGWAHDGRCDPERDLAALDCAPGSVGFPGEPCAPLDPPCGADGWPVAAKGEVPPLYVAAGAAPGGDGEGPRAPLGDLALALTLKRPLLLGPGTHLVDGSLDASASIVGCGGATIAPRPRQKLALAVTGSVAIAGVSIHGSVVGRPRWLGVSDAEVAALTVSGGEVRLARARIGVMVSSDGARLSADEVRVGEDGGGLGLSGPGTTASLRRVSVWGAKVPVSVTDGARLAWTDGAIVGPGGLVITAATATLAGLRVASATGVALRVEDGARATAARVSLTDTLDGLVVSGGAELEVSDLVVRRARGDESAGAAGYGIRARDAKLRASRVAIAETADVALQAEGSEIELADVHVSKALQAGASDDRPAAVGLVDGSRGRLVRYEVDGSRRDGVLVEGAHATLIDGRIFDVKGTGLVTRGPVTVERLRVARFDDRAWSVGGGAAPVVVEASDLHIGGHRTTSAWSCVFVGRGVHLTLERLRLADCRGTGVLVSTPELASAGLNRLVANDLDLRRTEDREQLGGSAFATLYGGVVTGARWYLEANSNAAIAIRADFDLPTPEVNDIHLTDLEVVGTACRRPGCQYQGTALLVENGGLARVERFRFADNRQAGVDVVLNSGVDLADGVVEGNNLGILLRYSGQYDLARLVDRVIYRDNQENIAVVEPPPP